MPRRYVIDPAGAAEARRHRGGGVGDLTRAYVRSWNAERELSHGLAPAELARPVAIAGPLRPAAGPGAGLEARTAWWVTGVTAIVLLIACANVAI